MKCFSELTYSIYADGELPAAEVKNVEAHLRDCAGCRTLVNTMRAENRMISALLAEARDELVTLPELQGELAGSPSRLIFGMMVALAGAILAFRAMLVGVSEWGLSQLGLLEPFANAVEWLDPSNWTARMNLFFSGVFYLLEEGAAMLPWLLAAVGSVIFVTALVAVSVYMSRRRPTGRPAGFNSVGLMMGIVLLLLLLVPSASAVEVHKNAQHFNIPAGTTINDSVIIGGDTATIDGDITGNLIFGGRRLTLRGNVKGDVLSGSRDTEIGGTVGGNVIIFAQSAVISSKIGGSAHVWAGQFQLTPTATIAGDLLVFSGDVDLMGQVDRDVMAYAGMAVAGNKIGRNFTLRVDRLRVASTAKIGGNLEAQVKDKDRVNIESGSVVGGKTSVELNSDAAYREARYQNGRFYFWQLIQLLGALIVGALFVALAPKFYRDTKQAVGCTWMPLLRNLGIGFAVLVAAPIAMVLACITLVGIPLAILSLMIYVVGLYMSKVFIAAMIGEAMLQRPGRSTQDLLVALLAGLAVYFVVVNLPFAVGATLHFFAMCIGLGAFAYRLVSPSPVVPVHDNL